MASKAKFSRSDLLDKLEEYNDELKGKAHCRLSATQEENGETHIHGPLRIYWGLESPIQLRQCDEISPTPSPSPSWRHSHHPSGTNGTITPTKRDLTVKSSAKLTISRGLDDSALLSPPIDTSNVVLRRKGIRKCNTVAYRGDQGNRWKRASINGQMYKNDTRVFVPVIGSCTSVTVTSNMPTAVVIKTLLEKFKVENLPDEYTLYIVPDEGEPRLLQNSDIPLLERLRLGADEKLGKIFIKEKTVPDVPAEAWHTLTLDDPVIQELRVPENVSLTPVIEISQEKQTEPLPEGLEQLVNLPLAVLQGLLQKFMNDEEHDVEIVQKKYERARDLVRRRLNDRTSQA